MNIKFEWITSFPYRPNRTLLEPTLPLLFTLGAWTHFGPQCNDHGLTTLVISVFCIIRGNDRLVQFYFFIEATHSERDRCISGNPATPKPPRKKMQ